MNHTRETGEGDNNNDLILGSDFCYHYDNNISSTPSSTRLPERIDNILDNNDSNNHDEKSLFQKQQVVAFRLRILPRTLVPPDDWPRQNHHQVLLLTSSETIPTTIIRYNNNDDRIVYTSNISILQTAGIISGNWAWLTIIKKWNHRDHNMTHPDDGNEIISNNNANIQKKNLSQISICVRVFLLPYQVVEEISECNNTNASNNESNPTNPNYDLENILYINEVTATNIGWIDLNNKTEFDNEQQFIIELHRHQNDNSLFDDEQQHIQAVDSVTLRIVGKKPPLDDNHTESQYNNEGDDILDKSIHAWEFPKPGTCIQLGTLLQTRRQIDDEFDENNRKVHSQQQYQSFFYEVMQIIPFTAKKTMTSIYSLQSFNNKRNDNMNHASSCVYLSSSKTKYRLQSPSTYLSIRLPPLRMIQRSLNTCQDNEISPLAENLCHLLPPHPDNFQLTQSFYTQQRLLMKHQDGAEDYSVCQSCMIWHVVGTEHDHHIIQSIQNTSKFVGRNCIVIQGLASYAYLSERRQQKQKDYDELLVDRSDDNMARKEDEIENDKNVDDNKIVEINDSENTNKQSNDEVHYTLITDTKTTTHRNGSMNEKVIGLKAALDEATYHSPSVLVVMDFDSEFHFNSDEQDDETIQDDIECIWNVIDNHYEQYRYKQQQEEDYYSIVEHPHLNQHNSRCVVPAVTIILNTSKPLRNKRQELLATQIRKKSLVSLQCSKPDVTYIQHLWKECCCRQSSSQQVISNNEYMKIVNDQIIDELLCGRDANEINQIFNNFLTTYKGIRSANNNKNREKQMDSLLSSSYDVITNDNSKDDEWDECLRSICKKYDDQNWQQKSGISSIPSTRWDDIGGLKHVRREIVDAIELPLNFPQYFLAPTTTTTQSSSNDDPTRNPSTTIISTTGILLYGPPGTGKTLVAKAVATECGLPFLSVKGPELLGSYVGESEANVRSIFMQARILAKQNYPKQACILFFDELDSLAPRRGDSASGGNVMDRVVATFFSELDNQSNSISEIMDGNNNDVNKETKIHIFFIGATNRPDLLDPALLRPGRIDRLVYLGLSPSDHADILFAQIRKLRLADDPRAMVSELLPYIPENVTGADLSTIATGALQRATERLCDDADKELLHKLQERPDEHITLDNILDSWDEDRLTPIVTLDDLMLAAKEVTPSVSIDELKKFEKMSKQFRMEV